MKHVHRALLILAWLLCLCGCQEGTSLRLPMVLAFWSGSAPGVERGDLEQLRKADFREVVNATQAFGFTKKDAWIRVALSNPDPQARRFVVRSGAPRVDSVLFLAERADGRLIRAESRNAADFGLIILPDRMPSFLLQLKAKESARVYLRFRSISALVVEPGVFTEEAFRELRRTESLLFGLGFGVLFFVLLFSLSLRTMSRSPTFMLYALYLISMGLLNFGQLGLAREYLPREISGTIGSLSVMLASFAAFSVFAFSRRFLVEADATLLGHPILLVLRVLQWLALLGLAAAHPNLLYFANRLVNIGGALGGFVVISAGVLAVRRRLPESGFFLFGWSLFALSVVWRFALITNVLPGGLSVPHSFQLGLLAENLVFAFMLGVRHRRIDGERALVSKELAKVEQELLAARRIHAQLLLPPPTGLPFDVSVHYIPHLGVGGDFYAFHAEEDGRLLVLLADVSGMGLSAALGAATVRLAFLHASAEEREPGRVLSAMSRYLAPYLDQRLVLAVCACVDLARGRIRVAAAGESPGVRLAQGRAALLEASGPPLGVVPDHAYSEEELVLDSGESRLLLFTDGLLHSASRHEPASVRATILALVGGAPAGEPDLGSQLLRRLSGADRSGLGDDATLLDFRFPAAPPAGSAPGIKV